MPSAANAEHYARIVREAALRRGIIRECWRTSEAAHAGDTEAADICDMAERNLSRLALEGSPRMGVMAGSVLPRVVESLTGDWTMERGGIRTGLDALDAVIGGLRKKNLIGIGAHTKHGKSALALNWATHAAIREGFPVAVFSFEMSEDEIVERLLLAESGLSKREFQEGLGNPGQQAAFAAAHKAIEEAKIIIDVESANTVDAIRGRARSYLRQYGVGLVVVDYYQLLDSTRGDRERRYERLVEVSRNLKLMANDLDVPVVVPCQLNAEAEKEDRLPRPNDVEECKKFPKDCNIFMVLDREWQRKRNDQAWCGNNRHLRRVATVDVCAIRGAAAARIDLTWKAEITRFVTADGPDNTIWG